MRSSNRCPSAWRLHLHFFGLYMLHLGPGLPDSDFRLIVFVVPIPFLGLNFLDPVTGLLCLLGHLLRSGDSAHESPGAVDKLLQFGLDVFPVDSRRSSINLSHSAFRSFDNPSIPSKRRALTAKLQKFRVHRYEIEVIEAAGKPQDFVSIHLLRTLRESLELLLEPVVRRSAISVHVIFDDT